LGGAEFSDELSYDTHFVSKTSSSIAFFASSATMARGELARVFAERDRRRWHVVAACVEWYAHCRERVVGSGGGVSAYEKEPAYQTAYKISKANGMRAIPDVSYNADPASGYPVYLTTGTGSKAKGAWDEVGGTSAGAPQWAAIQALAVPPCSQNFIPTRPPRARSNISVTSRAAPTALASITAPRASDMTT